ncbi:MAG TPA: FecR domain-containing protein [Chitinophaga sp.]|uniref:FecR family protein n=1 Tax=Chitinophaga sp. TaxID=1869181 RepID=UPI002C936FAD|nr:FecR domain-containing protein [Chitinophaga sp.]HVI47287.1 FecR domain-containing protein [Chitinophaga sp.]
MDNRDATSWKYLIAQYLDNRISKEELELLLQKIGEDEDTDQLTAVLQEQWEAAKAVDDSDHIDWDARFTAMIQQQPTAAPQRKNFRGIIRMAIAASIALLLALGGYFGLFKKNPQPSVAASMQHDIAPGTTGGILTLANGEHILLDSAGNGLLAMQGGTKIINRQGHITYNMAGTNSEQMFNTITTPRSKQFQLVLSDGSKVWLNAASSVRFPAAFAANERNVEITGEAYFEIAKITSKGKAVPFVVNANGTAIRVLGTHFNVNAYTDEHVVSTTLTEGSVVIKQGRIQQMLKPGEQAQTGQDGKLAVLHDVDTDAVLAWKNGYFSFNQADLPTVMRQISRWYDVDIVYEGRIPDRRFGGEISRNTNVSQVLKILEESKVHFRLEEKRIVVLP